MKTRPRQVFAAQVSAAQARFHAQRTGPDPAVANRSCLGRDEPTRYQQYQRGEIGMHPEHLRQRHINSNLDQVGHFRDSSTTLN